MALRIVNNIAWWILALWFAGFATLRPRSGQALDSPVPVGDLVAFLVVFGLFAGLGRWTARIAFRKGRNYVGWSYYGLLALREVVWVNSGTFGDDGTVRSRAACR